MEGSESKQLSLLGKFELAMREKGDVTFLVGQPGQEEQIKGSSFMLSTLSPVFESMFNEKEVIKLLDIQPKLIFNHKLVHTFFSHQILGK